MTQFTTLIEEVADESNYTLSAILLKSKLLASQLQSRDFRKWIDSELDGYSDVDLVPEYRIIYPDIQADYYGQQGQSWTGVSISLDEFPKNMQDNLGRHIFLDNIAELEALLDGESYTLRKNFTADLVGFIRQGPVPRVQNMEILGVSAIIAKHSVKGVLHAIRKRLLDFLIELREKYPNLESDSNAVTKLPESDVAKIAERTIYNNCTIVEQQAGEIHTGDKYETGQAGVVGPHSTAINSTFTQTWNEHGSHIDLSELVSELATLSKKMTERSSEPGHQVSIGNVEAAKQSAENGDGAKTLEYLKSAGKWAIDVAREIGVAVAVSAIKLAGDA